MEILTIFCSSYKVIPFQRTSCSISNGSKTPPLTDSAFVHCVCLQILLLLMPPSIRARMMAAVYLPPGVWPYSVQWRRHRIMWTLRPVSSRHMSPCSPGWATPPLLLRPCPLHIISGLHCTVQPASKLVLTTVAMSHHSTLNRDVQKCDLAPRVNPNNKA